jgi:hypothetical protein
LPACLLNCLPANMIFLNLLILFWHSDKNFCFYAEVSFWDFVRNDNSNKGPTARLNGGYETSGSPLRFRLRRSSLVEGFSVLHGNRCLQSVEFCFLR